jgi:hypothetical protein
MLQFYSRAMAFGPGIVTPSPLFTAEVGYSFSQQLSASGGTAPYVWSVLSGTLPAGLTLSPTGLISGTPTTPVASIFTAQLFDANNAEAFRQYSLNVVSAVQITTTSPLPNATQLAPYNFQMVASGGLAPYTWTLLSQTGSNGWSLTTTGVLSGTPSVGETDTLLIQVVDNLGKPSSANFNLTVSNSLTITTSSLPAGTQYAAYSTNLAAAGGVAPYTWALTAQSGINAWFMATNGTLTASPNPNIPLPDTLTIQVTDHVGNTASTTLSTTVNYVVPAGAAALGYTQLQWILLNPNLTQVNPGPYASTTTNYLYNGYWGNSGTSFSNIANITMVNGVMQAAYNTTGTGGETFICTQNTNGSGPPAAGNLAWLKNSLGWYVDFGISYTSWTTDCFGAVWLQATELNNAGTSGVINPAQPSYLKQWLEVDVWEAGASAGYQGNIDFHNGISGTQGNDNYQNLPHFTNPTQTIPHVYGASWLPTNGTVAWWIDNVTTGSKTLLNNAGTDGNTCNSTSLAWLNTQHMYALWDCGSHGAATPYAMNMYYIAAWAPPPLTALWPDPLPSGILNQPYSYTLTASGGIAPYTFALTSGTLPTGLSLNGATGIISGTPTVTVSMDALTFSVTDSS